MGKSSSQMRASSIKLVQSFDEAWEEGFPQDPLGLVKKVLESWGRLSQLETRSKPQRVGKWPRIQNEAIAIVRRKILSVNEDIDLFLLVGESVATPLQPSVGVKPNTWKSWRLGVFRDSRMFRAQQKGAKHLAMACSWCHWKGLETQISKMASHWRFGHLQPKLWAKEGPGVKLAV